MRPNRRADPVLELRDDLARPVEGRWVRAEHQSHVEFEADREATDLHVPLFKDVEQAGLHQFVQIREFVHREDAAVHSRDESEMNRLFGAEAGAADDPRGVDLADQIGELGSGGESFGISIIPMPPGDRHVFGVSIGDRPSAGPGDRRLRVFMDGRLRYVDVREPFIKKAREHSHEPALGLSLLTEEQQVVSRQNRQDDLRDDRVIETDDTRKEIFSPFQRRGEIRSEFLLHTPRAPTRGAKVGEIPGKIDGSGRSVGGDHGHEVILSRGSWVGV